MKSAKLRNPVIPTGDVRHVAKVRTGKQSSEIFCKNDKRRAELGLPPLPKPEDLD